MSDIAPILEIYCDPPINLKLNKYEISTYGNVRNKKTQRILKASDIGGYKYIRLGSSDNRRRNYAMHQLVALTFIPNPKNKPTVDHINHDPGNNKINNLRWATMLEQVNNRRRFKHKERKIIAAYNGNIVKIWDKMSDVLYEFPDIRKYLKNQIRHEYLMFYYSDKVILPGEFFRSVNINGVNKTVSSLGRIYSDRYKRLRYGSTHPYKYMTVKINGKTCKVSRVIGLAFVERPLHLINIPYEELKINHKNGDKENNIFTNLEWTTHTENVRHSVEQLHRTGMRAVVQYDLNGNFIAKYLNSVAATKTINKAHGEISIRDCCRGLQMTAYKYIWKYDGDELKELPNNRSYRVLQYTTNGEFVREYITAAEASRNTGVNANGIGKCCNFKISYAGNFIWRKKTYI